MVMNKIIVYYVLWQIADLAPEENKTELLAVLYDELIRSVCLGRNMACMRVCV